MTDQTTAEIIDHPAKSKLETQTTAKAAKAADKEAKLAENKAKADARALKKSEAEANKAAKKAQKQADLKAAIAEMNQPYAGLTYVEVIKEMNKRFAVVNTGKNGHKIYDEQHTDDPWIAQDSFKTLLAGNYYLPELKDGDTRIPKPVPIASLWLGSAIKRIHRGMVLHPEGRESDGDLYEGQGLNLWKGFLAPTYKESVDDFAREGVAFLLAHQLKVFHVGDKITYDWEIDYQAHTIQMPWEKPQGNVVRWDKEGGSGKSVWAKFWSRKVIGKKHAITVQGEKQLTNGFNAHMADALVVIGNEITWGGKQSARDILWGETGEDVRLKTLKGVDSFEVPNFSRYWLHANSERAVAVSRGDRRWLICGCVAPFKDEKSPESRAYFNKLAKYCKSRAVAKAYFELLMVRDIENFDPHQTPMSKAKQQMINRNMNNQDKWLFDFASDGFFTLADGSLFQLPTEDGATKFIATTEHVKAVAKPFAEFGFGGASSEGLARYLLETVQLKPKEKRIKGGVTPKSRGYTYPDLAEFRKRAGIYLKVSFGDEADGDDLADALLDNRLTAGADAVLGRDTLNEVEHKFAELRRTHAEDDERLGELDTLAANFYKHDRSHTDETKLAALDKLASEWFGQDRA
jgi:Family of unknown function (DUF5906)